MIESPLLQELFAEQAHRYILDVLDVRFGTTPPEVQALVRGVQDEDKLAELHRVAVRCASLDDFRAWLSS
jgi:hypothetical protein